MWLTAFEDLLERLSLNDLFGIFSELVLKFNQRISISIENWPDQGKEFNIKVN